MPLELRVRVLLVDDNSDDRFLIEELCKAFSFPVELVAVGSLKSAEVKWREQAFSAVLLDLDLGPTHGVETLSAARSLFPNVAIVLLTGNEDEDLMLECLRSGAQDFLVKGRYNLIELEKAIRFAIVRHARLVELEHKTEELDFMLDTQEIGLLVLDEGGRITHCNHAVCDIFGYAESALMGMGSLIPIPDDGSSEVFYSGANGERRTLEVRATESKWRGRVERLVTIIDVTDRKEMEHRASEGEKLETVARVCFGVAHEFNNLLAMTRTKADFLETLCEVDPVWAAHVEDLQLACERGSDLVKQLMTFYGKEEAGRFEDSYLEIGSFLRSWEPFLETAVGLDCSIEIVVEEEPLYVRISERNLSKVLMGLVNNAKDSMIGGGRIRLRTTRVPAKASKEGVAGARERLCISVVDEGCGISVEDQLRIFEPFYTTKDTRAGRGLGLSVVSNLLREHGGRIDFESVLGRGSEFRISLDCFEEEEVVRLSEGKGEGQKAPEKRSEKRGSDLTVLVVDDEPIIRFSIARLLEAEGCVVHCAENGAQALKHLEDLSLGCDVLLTDVNMPGMSGIELASRAGYLRDSLRVVVMSGYGASALDPKWVEDHAVRFLSKPFKKAELRDAVLEFEESRELL